MIKNRTALILPILASAVALVSLTACSQKEQVVSFSQDVKPVLDANCLDCHQPGAEGFEASGLDMTSHATVMAGTRFGPMVIAGDSMGSNLVVLMEGGADPSINMPHSGSKVPQAQIDIIKAWIDQGAQNN